MPRVCVIGGGVSGIAAAKALRERGIPHEVFEKGSQPGGLWRFGNDNGLSGIYDSLRLNTSKTLTAFSDFPMPREYPDYPDHRQFAGYLDRTIDRFGLGAAFRFRSEVIRLVSEQKGWSVGLSDGSTSRWDAAIVATGHHWKPRRPDFPGRFEGRLLHSHEYREASPFKAKRVLVIGIGNSAVDIACDVSTVASTTLLSTRRGAHVLPKHLFGLPIDRWGAGPLSYLPSRVQGWVVAAAVRLVRGSLSSYGLPKPAHRVDQAHPTLSSELLGRLRDGRIQARADVRLLEGNAVTFVDGRQDPVDVIVAATGYEVSHPFLGPPPVDPDRLYLNVVAPDHPGLYFVGLVQPFQGAVLRAAEGQSRWIADLISGRCGLPDPAAMGASIESERRSRATSFVQTPRHSLEVNHYAYLRALEKERKRPPV